MSADPLHALVRTLASGAADTLALDNPEDKASLVELVRAELAKTSASGPTGKRPSPTYTKLVSAFGVACESYGEQGAEGRPPARVAKRANDAEADLLSAIADLEARAVAADAARWHGWLRMWADVGAAHEHTIAMLHLGADHVEAHRRNVCAHCQEVHDVPSGAMAAHVRGCEKNPTAREMAQLRSDLARVTALAISAGRQLDEVWGLVDPDEPAAQAPVSATRKAVEQLHDRQAWAELTTALLDALTRALVVGSPQEAEERRGDIERHLGIEPRSGS